MLKKEKAEEKRVRRIQRKEADDTPAVSVMPDEEVEQPDELD